MKTPYGYVEIQHQHQFRMDRLSAKRSRAMWNGQAFNFDLATQPQQLFNNCFLDEAAESAGPPQNEADGGDGNRYATRRSFDTVTLQFNDPRELVNV